MDDTESLHTVSSSGISHSDVTILRHVDDNGLAIDVEKLLDQQGRSVAISLCAGRTINQNLTSRVGHSKFIVVLLSVATEKYLESLEFLQLEARKTLLLYENGFDQKWIRKEYRNIERDLRRETPHAIAQQIILFITSRTREENCSPMSCDEPRFSSSHFNALPGVGDEAASVEEWPRRLEGLPAHLVEELMPLVDQLGDLDERYSFFLISGHLGQSQSSPSDCLINLLNIPWLRVLDFDRDSRSDGLLSILETNLKERRAITIASDGVVDLAPRATDWCFALDMTDTLSDGNALDWFNSHQATLGKQFQQIGSFCNCVTTPVVVILWYGCSEFESQCLEWCLSLLFTKVSSKISNMKVVLCTDQTLNTPGVLQQMVKKYQLQATAKKISLSSVCQWMVTAQFHEERSVGGKQLPCKPPQSRVEISKEDVAWIQKVIELIHLEVSDQLRTEFCSDSEVEFLKGGTVSWDDLSTGMAAISRDTQELMNVKDALKRDILIDRKSMIISISHEPGSGGSTLGRQLLWELHRELPCGVVNCAGPLSTNELVERVKFLQKRTCLPIALLVDGKTEREVSTILDSCKCGVAIFHTQRCSSYELSSSYDPKNNECKLPGKVSKTEAEKLETLFREVVPRKKLPLQRLTASICQENRYIFEYGLTAFEYEYKGIRSYVRGYLNLPPPSDRLSNLLPDQKVVLYLALASYYGHKPLPCEVFRRVLDVDDRRFVSLKDMNFSCKQLIRADNVYWKINYDPIAKEILEQVLCSALGAENCGISELSANACTKLHHLVIDFLWMLKEAIQDERSQYIIDLLTKMLISRDQSGKGKGKAYGRQRPLSRLLEHVPNSENRIKILRKLSEAFPYCFEFHAHLGRLLGTLDQFNEAEDALETALCVLEKESSYHGQNVPRDALGRVYNMFGYVCFKRVRYEVKMMPKHNLAKVMDLFTSVHKAIDLFRKGRNCATYNLSYGYIGEIKARLIITKHVALNKAGGCAGAFSGSWESEYISLRNFILESHSECAYLLDQCYYTSTPEELKATHDFDQCKADYSRCFEGVPMMGWNKGDSVAERRSAIACLKIDRAKSKKRYFSAVDEVEDRDKISQIIRLHEANIRQVLENNLTYDITIDVLEWLDAIRHPGIVNNYLLEENVLHILNEWQSRNKEIHSTYYLYIITFVLAMFARDNSRWKYYNNRAKELRDNLVKKHHAFESKPLNQEVLAEHHPLTIRKLLCADRIVGRGKGKKRWTKHSLVQRFQPCTGTIIHSNTRSGIISLDTSVTSQQLEVFFVPLEWDLVEKRYADEKTRVEFFLRFSVQRGAEAIVIKKLTKGECVHCNRNNYIVTLNQERTICTPCFLSKSTQMMTMTQRSNDYSIY